MERRDSYQFPFSRYPAVRIAFLLIAGILFYHYSGIPLVSISIFLISVLVFLVGAEWVARNRVSTLWARLSTYLFLAFLFCFGMMRAGLQELSERSKTEQLLAISDWETVKVHGQVHSISYTRSGKERWDLKVDSSVVAGIPSGQDYKARILADEISQKVTLGDHISLSGTLIPISEKRNPKAFDYKSYLQSQGITAQVKAETLNGYTPNSRITEWIWWREQALTLVEKNFNEETAPIAKALLIGFKQDLDSDSKQAFARSGLSHIMAVSGLHVGFIVAPFWLIIPYFWTKKYGKILGLLSLVILLYCYAGITGFPSSVLRASVMAAFLTIGKLYNQLNNSVNFMAAAAIVLLIFNPNSLFDIGFQLSFSAVFIILLILPTIQTVLPYWLRTRWYGKPLMVVIISVVVQFGLYPLQVYYFGEISLVSPLANALFVPLLGIVVPLSLTCLIITIIFPLLGYYLNYPSLLFLEQMHSFVTNAATWEWAWASASLGSNLIFLFWIFLVAGIASWYIPALRWKMLMGALATLILIISIHTYDNFQSAKLRVTFFDVGQGDAALLKTPSGHHILVDVGVWSPGFNSGKSTIIPHLNANGVEKLDAVILSHPHADHIGGIIDLMEAIPINVIYNSGYEYDSKLYKKYIETAQRKDIPVKTLKAGDSLAIDPALLMLVYGPEGQIFTSDPNEHSVVVEVIYGATEFLFTGDAGIHQEERILSTYGNFLDTDVLKVGHHGSRTSSGSAFLNQATPLFSIISLGKTNRFRHPHREAVNRLGQTDSELLFTSKEKAVIFASDGEQIERIHWN
ncbi:MAG: DNA internalization-related competence protein ComEC/Rec2 [Gracilimonas sp.]|nr:DNA internalization-related competence protein ComEC/Rec2 [Gracilimonas sp.]